MNIMVQKIISLDSMNQKIISQDIIVDITVQKSITQYMIMETRVQKIIIPYMKVLIVNIMDPNIRMEIMDQNTISQGDTLVQITTLNTKDPDTMV